MNPQYPIQLRGTLTWLGDDGQWFQRKIPKAVFRSDRELAFDCDCGEPGDPFLYTVTLERTDENLFEGRFTGGKGEERTAGTVLCRLYSNSSGFVLIGIWKEEGVKDEWFAELLPKRDED